MPEDRATIMREFVKALETGDVEKSVSIFTDDGFYETPYGPYKGKEALRQLFTAMSRNIKGTKVTESGNGIIVQGDKAFYEHVISGTFQGKKFEMLALCAWEFSGEKVKNMRSVYDRLLIAQQAAPWFAGPMVNMIVSQSNKAVK
jgi:ketosteroid isomerase-like protein